jgi:hypothetical protein
MTRIGFGRKAKAKARIHHRGTQSRRSIREKVKSKIHADAKKVTTVKKCVLVLAIVGLTVSLGAGSLLAQATTSDTTTKKTTDTTKKAANATADTTRKAATATADTTKRAATATTYTTKKAARCYGRCVQEDG